MSSTTAPTPSTFARWERVPIGTFRRANARESGLLSDSGLGYTGNGFGGAPCSSSDTSELPLKLCAQGIRATITFPSCWDGKNTDSPDHRSHVAFLSTGPDNGTCDDPAFPYTLPRIFMEDSDESNRARIANL